jgi:glycosyltransferase involved in cell wall biosynthesis
VPQIRISIVIPCFNAGAYLREAVASALAAGRDDVEIIVVDDGSTDSATAKVIEALTGNNLVVLRQENRGLAGARNAAIIRARGEYILPLDADNRIRPSYVTESVAILDASPKVGVVYSDQQRFGLQSRRVRVGKFDLDRLLVSNYIDACAAYRRLIWEQHGGYDPKMPAMGWEDWDLWIGTACRGWEFKYLAEAHFEYRVSSNSMSANFGRHVEETHNYIASKYAKTYQLAFQRLWRERNSTRASAGNLAKAMGASALRRLGASR